MAMDEDTGFRSIGDLAREIVSSPEVLALTLTSMSSRNGRTTGSARADSVPGRSTGRELSTIVAGKSLTITAAQATNDPTAVDRALLASLPPSIQSACLERWVDNTDSGQPDEMIGYAFKTTPVDAIDLSIAIANVERGLAPCAPGAMKAELARLRSVTISRNTDQQDLTLIFAAYAEGLAEFPTDAVVDRLRYWGRNEKFWPSLYELRLLLEKSVRNRRSLLHALKAYQDVNAT